MADEEANPYELLDLAIDAGEADIRTAYRKRSLKVHPDRNPNNPDAARKFHELNQAYELLLDPLRRLALDAKLRLKEAKKLRYAQYDNKRKNMMEELEARERDFKKARMDKQKEEISRFQETERIKEEGKRMREKREEDLKRMEAERIQEAAPPQDTDADEPPDLGSLDTTVKLKYKISTHPTLVTTEALIKLLSQFGPIDTSSVVLSMKPPKKDPSKPAKFATALVPFKQIGDAFGAAGASGNASRGLDGIEITWAGGSEPPILEWLRKMGKLGSSTKRGEQAKSQATKEEASSNGSSATINSSIASAQFNVEIPGMDFESLTLMRLRQAERERLEQEIREQEES